MGLGTRLCQARQYADDTTLSVVDLCSHSKALEMKLNENLQKVQSWVQVNKLSLYVTKTQMMLVGRKCREEELANVHVMAGVCEVELERMK